MTKGAEKKAVLGGKAPGVRFVKAEGASEAGGSLASKTHSLEDLLARQKEVPAPLPLSPSPSALCTLCAPWEVSEPEPEPVRASVCAAACTRYERRTGQGSRLRGEHEGLGVGVRSVVWGAECAMGTGEC